MIIAFAVSFILAMLLVPLFVKLAHRFDFTDKPSERKLHTVPIPLIGGVVMFVAFMVGFIIFVGFMNPYDAHPDDVLDGLGVLAVVLGCAAIVGIGLVDDFVKTRGREFPVWPRLLVHVGVAVLAFAGGIRFEGFMNPFTDVYVTLPLAAQFVLTVLWFVGLVTAINWMDGLDGLAGLLSVLPGVVFLVVALNMGQSDSAVMSALFLGAVLGFLRYNIAGKKERHYCIMGDSGAYLLGFLLAAISLHGAFKQATVISMTVPMLALAVPIFDSILVAVRRVLARKPAHVADTKDVTHLHFRLIKSGMKPRHAVALIFLISACLNLMAVIVMLAF